MACMWPALPPPTVRLVAWLYSPLPVIPGGLLAPRVPFALSTPSQAACTLSLVRSTPSVDAPPLPPPTRFRSRSSVRHLSRRVVDDHPSPSHPGVWHSIH